MKKLLLSAVFAVALQATAHAAIVKEETNLEQCKALAPTITETVGMASVVSVTVLPAAPGGYTTTCAAQMKDKNGEQHGVGFYFTSDTSDQFSPSSMHWFVK